LCPSQHPDLSLFHAQGKIRHFWLFWKWSISPRADQDPVLLPLKAQWTSTPNRTLESKSYVTMQLHPSSSQRSTSLGQFGVKGIVAFSTATSHVWAESISQTAVSNYKSMQKMQKYTIQGIVGLWVNHFGSQEILPHPVIHPSSSVESKRSKGFVSRMVPRASVRRRDRCGSPLRARSVQP